MAKQWLRKFKLVVGDKDGNGLDLSDLRCRFEISQATIQTPKSLVARIYNVSKDTANKIEKEFIHVFLFAGYEENFGQIFSGQIRQRIYGRENNTDTYLEIIGAEGDEAYNWAFVNKTVAAGYTQKDVYSELVAPMKDHNVTKGVTPTFAEAVSPRGKVMYGMCRDQLRTFGQTNNCDWNISDGKVNMTPAGQPISKEAIVLNAATGMIGLPQQTMNGITVRCLINPSIKADTLLKIDNESIQGYRFSTSDIATDSLSYPDKDADGLYYVYTVQYIGDTRGNPWYCDLVCTAHEGVAPMTEAYLNAT